MMRLLIVCMRISSNFKASWEFFMKWREESHTQQNKKTSEILLKTKVRRGTSTRKKVSNFPSSLGQDRLLIAWFQSYCLNWFYFGYTQKVGVKSGKMRYWITQALRGKIFSKKLSCIVLWCPFLAWCQCWAKFFIFFFFKC